MGAEQFVTSAKGKTAAEAFKAAKDEAYYDHGHRGYTGTIAEKSEFKMVTRNQGETVENCVDRYLADEDHFCQDKWAPAACIEQGPDEKFPELKVFWFFGWASS